ncbi:hypothetical protein ACFQ9X_11405 [Catenulispora yoronensis]
MIASQGSGTPRNGATANPAPPAPTSTEAVSPTPRATSAPSATHASSSSSPSPAHRSSASAAAASHAPASSPTSAAGLPAPPPPSSSATAAASSTGSLLPGTYHRFRNAQSGGCLTQPAGSGTAGSQGCASDRTQGWEFSVPLTGILGAVTGQFELANGSSGQCLTGGGGAVGVRSCTGSAAQIWTRTGGSGVPRSFRTRATGSA